MCGFVAILGPSPEIGARGLTAMRDRLAHRGPDGAANWSCTYNGGTVSFGFRRLAIQDLRHLADQPMISADGRKVIVFNGEIYNFLELRKELEQLGCVFRTRSDTEVLLHAYDRWGDAFVERLNGMFSFIIWDESRNEALIARDRFGEKPLYYLVLPSGDWIFASEIKGVLAHPDVSVTIDTRKLSESLNGKLLFGVEETLFCGVKQFAAAHKMVLTLDGRIRSYQRYWSPSYGRALEGASTAQLSDQLRALLEKSLAMRMRSDVPVTACLSGGLDSSALVALLTQQSRRDGEGLSAVISARFSEDTTIDEGLYIDAVLGHLNIGGHSVTPSADDLVRDIRRMHWHHETVIPGASMYLEWTIMQAAREYGYKVIIDGQGSDEIFAGYSIYLQAYQAELYEKGAWFAALMLGYRRNRRLAREAKKYTQASRRFSRREGLPLAGMRAYQSQHVAHMIAEYGGNGMPDPASVGAMRFELAVNLLRTSLPSNLYFGDRNSMAHGIECRYPFLDYDLVDFAMNLPDAAYIENSWSKNILRRSIDGVLPKKIVWRVDKVGFAAPQDEWLRKPSMRSWLEERIFDENLDSIDGYDVGSMERHWCMHLNRETDYSQEIWRWASASEILAMYRDNIWAHGL